MGDSSSFIFQLRREDILQKVRERDALLAEIDEINAKLEGIDRWIDAVRLILPEELQAVFAATAHDLGGGEADGDEGSGRRSFWRSLVTEIISTSGTGMYPRDVAEAIRQGTDAEAKERFNNNPNGIYAALQRMTKSGEIVLDTGKYFWPKTYDRLKSEDNLDFSSETDNGMSSFTKFLIEVVRHGKRMEAKDIVKAVRESTNYSHIAQEKPQYTYTKLHRLLKTGRLKRVDDAYMLGDKENGPPDGDAPGGPDAGEPERAAHSIPPTDRRARMLD